MNVMIQLDEHGISVKLVEQCLNAAIEGPFFPDWEFSSLMGIDRDGMSLLKEQISKFSYLDSDKLPFLQNVINNCRFSGS